MALWGKKAFFMSSEFLYAFLYSGHCQFCSLTRAGWHPLFPPVPETSFHWQLQAKGELQLPQPRLNHWRYLSHLPRFTFFLSGALLLFGSPMAEGENIILNWDGSGKNLHCERLREKWKHSVFYLNSFLGSKTGYQWENKSNQCCHH